MGIHTADAVVLRRYLYRETSVIVTCLTDRCGKIKGLVKGLRVHPNRHRSAMEPLTVNRIVFYDTRSSQLHLISQCDLLSSLAELQRNLEVARVAGLFIDLVDTVVPLEEPQPLIYALLKHTLEHLAIAPHERLSLRIHFIARLLKLTGFQPQLDECTGCGSHVEETGYWSAKQGGLLCSACLHEDPRAMPAPSHTLEALSQLAQTDQPISLEESLVPLLNHQLDDFLRWRLDRPLKTLNT
jgi:DNA repair protein RecO (recombination protein O)